jgi:hypothetical protein
MSNQWISVKDRLPNDNESYLVCDLVTGEFLPDRGFMEDGVWHISGDPEFQVTHWMPFPPPPTSVGSQRPAAWVVKHGGLFMFVSQVEGVAETQCREGMVVVPLYEHAPPPPDRPVGLGFEDMRLTDAERGAITEALVANEQDVKLFGGEAAKADAAALRGLLERLG